MYIHMYIQLKCSTFSWGGRCIWCVHFFSLHLKTFFVAVQTQSILRFLVTYVQNMNFCVAITMVLVHFGSLFWLNELKVIWRSSGSCFSLHSRRFRRSNGRPEFSMGQREEECVECQIVSKYFLHSFVSLTRSAARCCNWACANHRCCPCDQCSIWAQLMIRLDGVHGPWPSVQWRKWFWNNRICRVGPGTFISPE